MSARALSRLGNTYRLYPASRCVRCGDDMACVAGMERVKGIELVLLPPKKIEDHPLDAILVPRFVPLNLGFESLEDAARVNLLPSRDAISD